MAASGAYGQATAERPNVILLVADDLGYGDLSCYGAERVSTPRVDSIARGGVRFTDAHAVASTSTPSRYSLLTGEYSFRRPETNVANGDAHLLIDPDQYTLADMFRDQGYTTAAIGKWHLGLGSVSGQQNWNRPLDLTPEDIGFDYSYIMAATADRVPCVFIENGSVKNYDPTAPISVSYTSNFAGEPTGASNPELLTKLKPSPNHGHNQSIVNGISRIGYMKGGGRALWRDEDIADSIATYAVRFMGENADKPFFMYLCTNDVHVPRYPHERFRGKSPMGLRGEAILQFDYTVGLIADALDSLGIADNALLIMAYAKAFELTKNPQANLIMTGGELSHSTLNLGGEIFGAYIRDITISKAFVGVAGIDLNRGYTVTTAGEFNVVNLIREISDTTYIVADSSKFRKKQFIRYADLAQSHSLITDRLPEGEFMEYYRQHNIPVYTPETV